MLQHERVRYMLHQPIYRHKEQTDRITTPVTK